MSSIIRVYIAVIGGVHYGTYGVNVLSVEEDGISSRNLVRHHVENLGRVKAGRRAGRIKGQLKLVRPASGCQIDLNDPTRYRFGPGEIQLISSSRPAIEKAIKAQIAAALAR